VLARILSPLPGLFESSVSVLACAAKDSQPGRSRYFKLVWRRHFPGLTPGANHLSRLWRLFVIGFCLRTSESLSLERTLCI